MNLGDEPDYLDKPPGLLGSGPGCQRHDGENKRPLQAMVQLRRRKGPEAKECRPAPERLLPRSADFRCQPDGAREAPEAAAGLLSECLRMLMGEADLSQCLS